MEKEPDKIILLQQWLSQKYTNYGENNWYGNGNVT